MNINISDDEHQRRYTDEIKQSRLKGMNNFHSWFDKSENVNESIIRGYWDFSIHILTPRVCESLENPEKRTALEIGYGGGRILNAACAYFREAIGIDIHDEQETVSEFLYSQGKKNHRLVRTNGRTIDVESNSVDFIFSFIVLQHLSSFEVFQCYLKETYRCLKPNGIAQLYYGSFSKLDRNEQRFYKKQGYKELIDAPINHTSLVVHEKKAKQLSEAIGFKIIDSGHSYKRVPDGYKHKIGGQNYITLFKSISID